MLLRLLSVHTGSFEQSGVTWASKKPTTTRSIDCNITSNAERYRHKHSWLAAFWVGFILYRNGWRTTVYRMSQSGSFQELVCNVHVYYSELLAANHEQVYGSPTP
jgi:hypothetical protein